MRWAHRHQTRLDTFIPDLSVKSTDNLPPTGNNIPSETDPADIRFAFQNIHGAMLDAGLSLPNEIEAISDWSIDIMGMSETNHHGRQNRRQTTTI